MLRIESKFVERIRAAASGPDLYELLQAAIQLEHATIPVYLTAMMSLHPRTNGEVRGILHSVVIEEMLHLAIACNLLNALGGQPALDRPDFIPRYPSPLPMSIGGAGLIAGLEPFSAGLVARVFMEIEEPEKPLVFRAANLAAAPAFATIGLFYAELAAKITELGAPAFTGDPARQVVSPLWFPAEQLFAIVDVATAVAAIDLIVKQGEGAPDTPLDPEGDLAHYYRFQQIVKGRRLIKDAAAPGGFSFTGAPISVDPAAIWNLKPNTKAAEVAEGTEQRRLAGEFNFSYGRLLKALQRAFDGEPAHLDNSMGLMYDVKLIGETLAAMEFPGQPGFRVGPPFEFALVNE